MGEALNIQEYFFCYLLDLTRLLSEKIENTHFSGSTWTFICHIFLWSLFSTHHSPVINDKLSFSATFFGQIKTIKADNPAPHPSHHRVCWPPLWGNGKDRRPQGAWVFWQYLSWGIPDQGCSCTRLYSGITRNLGIAISRILYFSFYILKKYWVLTHF